MGQDCTEKVEATKLYYIFATLTVLNSIDTPVSDFDDLIERDERSLQRRQLNQKLHSALEVLLQLGQLLPTSRQTRQLVCIWAVLVGLENGKGNTWGFEGCEIIINKLSQ